MCHSHESPHTTLLPTLREPILFIDWGKGVNFWMKLKGERGLFLIDLSE